MPWVPEPQHPSCLPVLCSVSNLGWFGRPGRRDLPRELEGAVQLPWAVMGWPGRGKVLASGLRTGKCQAKGAAVIMGLSYKGMLGVQGQGYEGEPWAGAQAEQEGRTGLAR